MRKITFLMIILMVTVLVLAACGPRPLTMEEKEQYLEKALEEREIENVDEELTEMLMEEEKIRYAYVADQDDVVQVYITFTAGASDSFIDETNRMAKEMAEEKYPDRSVRVSGSVDVD